MKTTKKEISGFKKRILLILGTIFTVAGFIGVFVPLWPTTPFLLLAAACYFRSSKKFYNWLMNHKLLGFYIKNYREHQAIPIRAKIITLSLLWLTISYSAIFVVDILFVRILLLCIAIGVTVHLLLLKTLPAKATDKNTHS